MSTTVDATVSIYKLLIDVVQCISMSWPNNEPKMASMRMSMCRCSSDPGDLKWTNYTKSNKLHVVDNLLVC